MFKIIQKRKIWYTISIILSLLSICSLFIWKLKLNTDFTGGSLLEIKFINRTLSNQEISEAVKELNLPYLNIQPTEDNTVLIKTKTLTEEEHQQILNKLTNYLLPENHQGQSEIELTPEQLGLTGEGLENLTITTSAGQNQEIQLTSAFEELRFDSIGPTISSELKQKAIYSIILVNIAIIIYIAYAFRKVSYPVESWKYGVSAVIALIHDILITTGIYSILGHYFNYYVDTLFVTALLTILGFSVHDTIVTFDRIRENLRLHQDKTFEDVINLSVNQTIVRSVNTSATVFLILVAIFLFGGQTISHFILTLMIGVIFGTYSSIFIASPLLLLWYKFKKY